MLIKFTGFLILTVYFLVLIVALTAGPLVSYQSFILGVIGLVFILLLTSSIARKINLVDIGNEPRKEHIGVIPLVGGIGLFISLIYGAFVFGVEIVFNSVDQSLFDIVWFTFLIKNSTTSLIFGINPE